jgi:septal ring factor EnvC (AmiA/AmiB activator)
VLVEHPYRADTTLIAPEKPTERSRDFYRFEVKLKPKEQSSLQVVEDQQRGEKSAMTNVSDQKIAVYSSQSAVTPRVKEAFQKALELKGEWEATQKEIRDENNALKVIEQDQARMRANMERVPQTSEAYKRYLKKFDDQETEIEKRRAAITKLQATADKQRNDYESFLTNLNVE